MPVALDIAPSIPHQRVSTTLEGADYIFDFRWNARDGSGAWYMDVSTDTDEIIRRGIKVVMGVPLGKRTADDRYPPGALFAIDDGTGVEATLDDLGVRVQVLYFTTEEVAAL